MAPSIVSPANQPRVPSFSFAEDNASAPEPAASPRFTMRHSAWNPRQKLIDLNLIGGNDLNVVCPTRTAVQVNTGSAAGAKQQPIHANVVKFVRGVKGPIINATYRGKSTLAVVGQSPQTFDLTERFLVQGLDSGRGLFQFVSPRTQGGHVSRRDKPVISQVAAALDSCSKIPGKVLVLADRYEVIGFDPIMSGDDGNDHGCYRLMACDRQNNFEIKSMLVTQAGLKFDDALLHSEQIARASKLMDWHREKCPPLDPQVHPQQDDPITASFAGIGRSATLSVYREAKARFDDGLDEAGLDDAIDEIIAAGRRDRGPRFVHSDAQEAELKTALLEELRRRQAVPISRTDSPRAAALRREVQADTDRPVSDSGAAAADPVPEPASAIVPLAALSAPDRIEQPPSPPEMMAFIADHVDNSPLQFFEAVARKDPLLAAFCAVQARRMLTPSSMPEDDEIPVASMHAAIERVGSIADRSYEDGGLAINPLTVYALQATKRMAAEFIPQLAADLETVTSTDEGVAVVPPHDATPQFPNGYRAALQSNRRKALHGRSVPEKLSESALSELLKKPFLSVLELVEDLAPQNPQAATFFHMLDHALLVSNSRQERPCSRYEYVENDDYLRIQVKETHKPFLPTFLPGICRRLTSKEGKPEWRIEDRLGNLKEIESKQDVLRHVFEQALAHLHAEQATSDQMPVFPLVFYELLADATALQVPQYLKTTEAGILAAIVDNRDAVEAQSQQREVERLEREEQKKRTAEEERIYCEAHDINNTDQDLLLQGGFKRDLSEKTVDEILSVPSVNADPTILDELRDAMLSTHDMQVISARSHDFTYTDNQCYTRASWLSVFAQATPEKLFEIITSIGNTPVDAAVLEAIANVYQRDPVAFMQRVASGNTQNDQKMSMQDNLHRAAHLGPDVPLRELLGNQFPHDDSMYFMNREAESFLKNLQLRIAAAFRPKGQSRLMSELQGLMRPGSPATSDVPVYLHRALGLPVLIVEIDTKLKNNGERAERTVNLRATVPKTNKALAELLEQLSAQGDLPADGIKTVLALFKDIPVLWLETNHYTTYLPKQITQGAEAVLSLREERPSGMTPPPAPSLIQRVRQFFTTP